MSKRDTMKYEYPYNFLKYALEYTSIYDKDEAIKKAEKDKGVIARYEESLASCPEKSIIVVKRHFQDGCTYKEIAKELNVSVSIATSAARKAGNTICRDYHYIFDGKGETLAARTKRRNEEYQADIEEENRQIKEKDFTLKSDLFNLEKAFFPFRCHRIFLKLTKDNDIYPFTIKHVLETRIKTIEEITDKRNACKLGVILEYCGFELPEDWKAFLDENKEIADKWRGKVSQNVCKDPLTSMSVTATKVYCLIKRKDENGFAVEKLSLTSIDKTSPLYEDYHIVVEGKEINGCFIGNCDLYIDDFDKEQDYGKYTVTYFTSCEKLFKAIKETLK